MTNRDKFFKGQQDNEQFICFFRHHWIVLLREFFYFLILILIFFLIVSNVDIVRQFALNGPPSQFLLVIGFVTITFFLHRFFVILLNYFVNIGIITNLRFIDHQKTIFFHDKMESIDLGQIQEIEQDSEGILPTFLKYGDIKIYIMGIGDMKTFHCIQNVKFHFRCINRQKTEYSQRMESLLKEQQKMSEQPVRIE